MRLHRYRPRTAEPGPPEVPPRRRGLMTAALVTAGIAAAVAGAAGVAGRVPGDVLSSSGGSVSGSVGESVGGVPGSLTHGEARAEPPAPGQRVEFLARLGLIAPWLAAEKDRSLIRARATCDDIRRGRPDGQLVSDAQERFTDVTAGQAAEIVEAVRRWCAP
ncbi:hypothetical protein FHU36_005848 [Nonomuraea muscovyensis]|uniref:DUF732 domain-containing protein n=1 Tax=Nonomuraea muscovyensis TaxID=1124761 RepID=A0A7X0C692_9ACTN|nr:DUF732 domain-containing protein [Nonomuraea muscovyensis]MBB6349303.1 hypothetical protein [Nonomuraea muscovyensis]